MEIVIDRIEVSGNEVSYKLDMSRMGLA